MATIAWMPDRRNMEYRPRYRAIRLRSCSYRLKYSDLLIIDDWLLEKIKPNEAREIMEVIEARDRTGSLILCSQFAPSAWHSKLGNGAIADAVIDRVVYKSYTIHIEGDESMRKRMDGIN